MHTYINLYQHVCARKEEKILKGTTYVLKNRATGFLWNKAKKNLPRKKKSHHFQEIQKNILEDEWNADLIYVEKWSMDRKRAVVGNLNEIFPASLTDIE